MTHDVDMMEAKLNRRGGCLKRGIFWTLLLLSILLLLRWVLTVSVVVPDQSMYPGIEQGSRLLVWKVGTPDVGDVVLIRLDEGHVVSRVVARPGSTVRQTRRGIEVNGDILGRQPRDEHVYNLLGPEGISVTELTCQEADEVIAERPIRLCVSSQSERGDEAVEVGPDEVYVRCDNRAFCARRQMPEGRVPLESVVGRAIFVMATRNDDDQPFYKRWFGLFEEVP